MDVLLFLGQGELLPEVVERLGFGGYGGDGLAVVDFVVDVVDPLGGEDEGGLEGVEGAVGHAEGDDVVVAWHFVLSRLGKGAYAGLVDEDDGSDGSGVVGVVDWVELGRQTEGVGEVARGVVATEGKRHDLLFVAGDGEQLLAYPWLTDRAFQESPFHIEEVAIGRVGTGGLPAVGIGAVGDVGELEEVVVAGFEEVYSLVGLRVDEGDAGA